MLIEPTGNGVNPSTNFRCKFCLLLFVFAWLSPFHSSLRCAFLTVLRWFLYDATEIRLMTARDRSQILLSNLQQQHPSGAGAAIRSLNLRTRRFIAWTATVAPQFAIAPSTGTLYLVICRESGNGDKRMASVRLRRGNHKMAGTKKQ